MKLPESPQACFDIIKPILIKHNYNVNPFRDIQYGIQFIAFKEDISGIIRIFKGKKGLKLDLSQVKDEALFKELTDLLNPVFGIEDESLLVFDPSKKQSKKSKLDEHFGTAPPKDPKDLIGIDESGKGDYFGPLVVAAVRTTPENIPILEEIGVKDSKSLSDFQVLAIAPQIKEATEHSLVIMGNQSYNDVYQKIGNLNQVLAWGHARVLENVLNQSHCDHALSDQFGSKALVQSHLFSKGREITLYQRHRAESNIAVAAASILARATFLQRLKHLNKTFDFKFPKGCSAKTLQTGIQFVEKYGENELQYVAKLHFTLTNEIRARILDKVKKEKESDSE